MATFLEEPEEFNEESLQEDEQLETFNTLDPEKDSLGEEEEVDGNVTEEEELPEKYRGKSVTEIVQMHSEAEKLVGRQSSEVGELRKLVDDFVKTNLNSNAQGAKEPEEEIDFFDKPQESINKTIAANPDIQEIKQLRQELLKQEAIGKLNSVHPDFMATAQSEPFQDWVKASKVRTELLVRADSKFDFDAADELLTNWKEKLQVVSQTKDIASKDRGQQRKAASTGSAKGTGESRSKKIYRRSEIMNLMQNDPKRYQQLADELLIAYEEGRVRA